MSKKKAIIFFMTLAIVLGVGAWFYNNAKQEQREKDKIEAYKNEITMALNSFHEKTDKTEKIELFRQLQDSQYIYLNEDAKYQEITDLYENSLNQMEQSFIDFYNEEFQKVLEVGLLSLGCCQSRCGLAEPHFAGRDLPLRASQFIHQLRPLAALLLLAADGAYTFALLRATGDTDSLRWYRRG